ncbi:MAG: hypothetical protein L6R35_007227 [Caloplaca aegaea]|nr:MAG: hypothetical protein L6R35_007227 [Caloplaca aegaea]
METPQSSYPAAQSWSYRVPSPPRLNVPPTGFLKQSPAGMAVAPSKTHDFGSTGFSNTDFLSAVTYSDYITGREPQEWTYDHRWEAQRILPFLYLGPVSVARSRGFLKDNGITMVLAVRDTKSAHARLLGSKVAVEMGIAYATVDTAGNQELIAAFPRGIEIINAHLSAMYHQSQRISTDTTPASPGKVLVFCESGNGRSAAMVVAYIMAMFSMDVVKAILIVQSQRFAVAFDDDMKLLLQTYDSILSAKRMVLLTDRQDSGAQIDPDPMFPGIYGWRKPFKRALNEAEDEDDDMDCGDDGEISGGPSLEKRNGAAPFLDNADRGR